MQTCHTGFSKAPNFHSFPEQVSTHLHRTESPQNCSHNLCRQMIYRYRNDELDSNLKFVAFEGLKIVEIAVCWRLLKVWRFEGLKFIEGCWSMLKYVLGCNNLQHTAKTIKAATTSNILYQPSKATNFKSNKGCSRKCAGADKHLQLRFEKCVILCQFGVCQYAKLNKQANHKYLKTFVFQGVKKHYIGWVILRNRPQTTFKSLNTSILPSKPHKIQEHESFYGSSRHLW